MEENTATQTDTAPIDLFSLSLAERNAAFRALSPSEQRRAIARDAIAQIHANKYEACKGIYFSGSILDEEYSQRLREQTLAFDLSQAELPVRQRKDYSLDLQEILESQNSQCEVCGIGAIFASSVRLSNDVTTRIDAWGHFSAGAKLRSKLINLFDGEQLQLVEHAFEMWRTSSEGEEHLDQAARFGERFENATDRLLAIMQKVADHPEGLFVP